MRKSFLIMVTALAASTVFSSCTKFYNCECTDHQGKLTRHTVNAKTKVQAEDKCNDSGELENCELK